MPKAKKDMIDRDTFRKVKGMSLPELNTFLYSIYLAGYTDGRIDVRTQVMSQEEHSELHKH